MYIIYRLSIWNRYSTVLFGLLKLVFSVRIIWFRSNFIDMIFIIMFSYFWSVISMFSVDIWFEVFEFEVFVVVVEVLVVEVGGVFVFVVLWMES